MRVEKKSLTKEQIEAYIKEQEGAVLEDLKKLISFRTTADEPDEITASLDWFLHRASEMGLKVYKTSTNDVGIIEMGQGQETLGILVHLDVVGVGDPAKWIYPPFEGTLAEGSIWGRGTMDDKGAAVICLHAMKALVDFDLPVHKKIQLVVGTSEEDEWTDMENFKSEFPCPDYGFSPDGDFPVYNIENGYIDIELSFDEGELIERHNHFNAYAGEDANTVPSKAVLEIDDRTAVYHGVSAHSSTPELGVNAIDKLCADIDSHFARFVREILGGDANGGKLRFEGEADFWEEQPLERTTAVPTILRRRDDHVVLTVNIRQNANMVRRDIEKAFDAYKEQYHYQYKVVKYMEPMTVSRHLKPFSVMADTYEDWGYSNSFLTAAGSSYAKSMDHFVSWGPCFPEDLSCCHQENERISISSLFHAMGIYLDYLLRIAGEKENLLYRKLV